MKAHQEPEPADPDYVDQRAGDLQVGSYGYVVLYERKRKLPPKTPRRVRASGEGDEMPTLRWLKCLLGFHLPVELQNEDGTVVRFCLWCGQRK